MRKTRPSTNTGASSEMPSFSFWLTALCLLAVLMQIGLAFHTPVGQNGLFHTPDEGAHLQYVRYVAEHSTTPKFEGYSGVGGYEAHQPPAYYILAGNLYRAVSPFTDSPARWVRLLSVLFGVLAMLAVYKTSRWLYNGSQTMALAATAFYGLLPMNLFLNSAINNDPLANLMFALCVMETAQIYAQRELNPWPITRIGLWLGIGLLTKMNFAIAFGFVMFAIILSPGRDRRQKWITALISSVISLCLAAPYWISTIRSRPDDPLLLKAFEQTFKTTALADQIITQTGGMLGYIKLVTNWTFKSFWFAYGTPSTMKVGMPAFWQDGVYNVLLIVCVIAFVGYIFGLFTNKSDNSQALPTWWWPAWALIAVVVLGFAGFTLKYFQTQGRYLFGALGPIAIIFAFGWRSIFPRAVRGGADLILILTMVTLSAMAIFTIW
ncbi:MAG: glycosyltransferase family 39 protein [Armatimonadota bacterium]